MPKRKASSPVQSLQKKTCCMLKYLFLIVCSLHSPTNSTMRGGIEKCVIYKYPVKEEKDDLHGKDRL